MCATLNQRPRNVHYKNCAYTVSAHGTVQNFEKASNVKEELLSNNQIENSMCIKSFRYGSRAGVNVRNKQDDISYHSTVNGTRQADFRNC